MNKRWFYVVSFIGLWAIQGAQTSAAVCNNNSCSNVDLILISVTETATVFFISGGTSGGTQCQGLGTAISVPNDHPRRKEIYATALAAKLAGKTMSFGLKAGTCIISSANF